MKQYVKNENLKRQGCAFLCRTIKYSHKSSYYGWIKVNISIKLVSVFNKSFLDL